MKKLIAVFMLIFAMNIAYAEDLKVESTLQQKHLETLAKEVGNVIYFNPGGPSDPLGVTGFEVSVESGYIEIDQNDDAWDAVTENNSQDSAIIFNKVRFQKGLPFKIDLGAYVGTSPNSNIGAYGAEIKYAILEGTAATPAWGVRATYSKLNGVNDFDASTKSIETGISKGFLFVKPYANAALVNTSLDEKSNLVNLEEEDVTYTKLTAGLEVTPFPFFRINAEFSTGETNNFYLKAGIRF